MGIQDRIFDVRSDLEERSPQSLGDFDFLMTYLGQLESALDAAEEKMNSYKKTLQVIAEVYQEKVKSDKRRDRHE